MRLAAAIYLAVKLALLDTTEVARAALFPRPFSLAALPRERRCERGVAELHMDRVVLARVRRRRNRWMVWGAERGGGRRVRGEKLAREPAELVPEAVARERAPAVGVWHFEALLRGWSVECLWIWKT